MGYVDAGYAFVLSVLALYGALLVWRRRRLVRAVERVVATSVPPGPGPAAASPRPAGGGA